MGEAKRRGNFEERKQQALDSKTPQVIKKLRPFRGRKAALVSAVLFGMGAYFLH